MTTVPRPTTGLLRDILGVLERHGHRPVSGRDLALALPDLDARLGDLVAAATEAPAGVAGV
ncbi:hypothetical protein ACFYOC_25295 [Nocardiopsis alba]|uniref:hypothetical protein n=1 Tax=Nocardiopsis alba TaxID=53437 RepID=UPI0036CE79B3